MTILAIIGLVVMGIILGKVTHSCSHTCDMGHWDYDSKSSKLAALETKVFILEREKERTDYLLREFMDRKRCFYENYAAHCRTCSKNFYSKSPDEERLLQIIANGQKTAEQLLKDLRV